MSQDLDNNDLMEEELDFGLLDESDDYNVEVEEMADTKSKLQKLLHQEKMSQAGDSKDPRPPKQRPRLVFLLFPSTRLLTIFCIAQGAPA